MRFKINKINLTIFFYFHNQILVRTTKVFLKQPKFSWENKKFLLTL